MAREPVVAVDFLGLNTSIRERENELKAEKERLVKPSLLAPEQSSGRGSAGDDEHDISLPRLGLRTDSGSLTFSLDQARPWTSIAGKGDEMERSSVFAEEKRIEELSEAEIMQLSVEECRRYMLKSKKEREMLRPTPNTMATPGLSTLRSPFRIETRHEEEKLKRGGPYNKSAQPDASSLSVPSGPAFQLEVGGPASSSGFRNLSPAPWHTVQSRASPGEEGSGGAGPSERALNTHNLSPLIPTTQEQPLGQAGGFGSPVPNFLKLLRTTENSQRPLQSGQGSGAPLGTSRSPGQSHLPGRPPTAQLTIFYSGVVNVYDGVPADKAQAIMLLAGSGSSWSSSTMNPPMSAPVLPSTGGMASSSNSPARSGPAPAVAVVSQAGPVTSPLVPTISVAASLKQVAGRPTLHAELPQARKASLARFLEKRKDRVRGKAPYVSPILSLKKDVGSSTPPREKSPSPMNRNTSTRSPSPANAGPRRIVVSQKRSLSPPTQRPGRPQLNSNETSSPKSQLKAPPQGPQPASSEDQTSTSATQRPIPEDLVDWRRQQHPRLSSQEQKQEAMETDQGSPSQCR